MGEHVKSHLVTELGTDVPRMVVMEVDGSGSLRDILLRDLSRDMEGEFKRLYGEALAPVLLRAMGELAAETAMSFFDMDEHLEALNFAETLDGAG